MHYREDGHEHLRCLGETEFVVEQAEQSVGVEGQAEIAAIVARADLTLGSDVGEVLEAHQVCGAGRMRGIRQAGAFPQYPEDLIQPPPGHRSTQGLYQRADFRCGLKVLGQFGLTYDAWHYHYQNTEFAALAENVPGTTLILNHFGTPLGVGRYANQRQSIFEQWKIDIREISQYPNVVAKIGGLAMPDNGFGWHSHACPPTSDEFVEAQKAYYLHTIECFGPERCMLESNFPVDRRSISYAVLYNGLKKIVAGFSEAEKDQMFYGTAARIYRI